MPKAETLAAVVHYIRSYFDEPTAQIAPHTCLVERFNASDPDAFTDFLVEFCEDFDVRLPLHQIYVSRLTLERLCEIAEVRLWPEGDLRT